MTRGRGIWQGRGMGHVAGALNIHVVGCGDM